MNVFASVSKFGLLKNTQQTILQRWDAKHLLLPIFKGELIRATNWCNLHRNIVALQVEKRSWPCYHPPQTLSRNKICCCKLKKCVVVDASSTWWLIHLQRAITKFCCVTMFEVGGSTWNNAFQVATQVEEKITHNSNSNEYFILQNA